MLAKTMCMLPNRTLSAESWRAALAWRAACCFSKKNRRMQGFVRLASRGIVISGDTPAAVLDQLEAFQGARLQDRVAEQLDLLCINNLVVSCYGWHG